MPVSFDFVNGTSFAAAFGVDPGPLAFTDVDGVGLTQSVQFTISTGGSGGGESVEFGLTSGGVNTVNLRLTDFETGATNNDAWTLTFQDNGNTANNQLTGNTTNPVAFNVAAITGTVQYSLLTSGGTGATGVITATGSVQAPTALNGMGITGIRFTTAGLGVDRIQIDLLTANALNCYLEGTRIATPEGPVDVQNLRAGDHVLTADGRAVKVRWLGRQFVDTRVVHPAKVNPVCISAGALAEGVPERDLFVSPDHAIGIDGYIVSAGALVNGRSVYQVRNMPMDGFTYYHIETEAHELLLAEGCPAESFLDYSDTFGFDNADERADRVIPEMDLPRISSGRMVPARVKAKLSERRSKIAA